MPTEIRWANGYHLAPGRRYRHYKGGLYRVVAVAFEEATKAEVVVYTSAERDDCVWVRPLGSWMDELRLSDGRVVRRFEMDPAEPAVTAPWTADQVVTLNARQSDPTRHPYTCGADIAHRPLVATPAGWACADCDYRQGWAHGFDATGGP